MTLFLQWPYAVYFEFYYDSAHIYVFISLEKVSQRNDLPTSSTRLFYVRSLVSDVFQKCRPVTALQPVSRKTGSSGTVIAHARAQ